MANKEPEIKCENVFMMGGRDARKEEYSRKWAVLINMWEKCKGKKI